MFSKRRGSFLLGLGLVGLVLVFCLVDNQSSFDSYAGNYEGALKQTTRLENRMSDLLTIRGELNGIAESVAQRNIDPAAIATLRTAWAQFRNQGAIPASTRAKLDAGIDRIAFAAEGTAEGLRRKDFDEARRQTQSFRQVHAEVLPLFTRLEDQLVEGRAQADAERLHAFVGMNQGQSIAVFAFLAIAALMASFFLRGLRSFRDWLNHQPRRVPVTANRLASRGFSIIEMLMVTAITLVVSTIAIANIGAVVSSSRIRAGMSSMTGLLQNTRMLAVKKNRTLTSHMIRKDRGMLVGYVKDAGDAAVLTGTDTQVEWEAPVVKFETPSGDGAPDELTVTDLGFTPQTSDISFNSRGLPCSYVSGVCTNYGFLYYFKDTSRAATKGWAALSVSPAGKIKKWFWNSGRWTD